MLVTWFLKVCRASRGWISLVTALGAMIPSVALAEGKLLVLDANANSGFQPGQIIESGADLTLPTGARLWLLDQDGRTSRVEGPYSGRPEGDDRDGDTVLDDKRLERLAELLAERASGKGLGGPSRSGAVTAEPPSPWAVSVHQPGHACASHDRITFWRTSAQRAGGLTIEMSAAGRRARLPWIQGQDLLPVPISIFANGRTYKVAHDEETVDLTVHIPRRNDYTPVEWAVWMADAGCTVQALAMLDALK